MKNIEAVILSNMNPKLIVEQKITPFVNKYAVYQADPSGKKAEMVAFAQQKRLALKEKIEFYNDESKASLAFTLRAEKVLDVHGKYFVEDASGMRIGAFQKAFAKSLLNSTWNILGSDDQPILTVSENNQTLALLRRFGGVVPVVGGAIEIIALFLRYHFKFVVSATSEEVGMYEKTTLWRDHYRLSVTDQVYSSIDWRIMAAFSVALDALQSR